VGERWALLIVRELLARPSRYTDLLADLPGIPTNVLSTRLKELEEAGLVERQVAPSPQRGVRYALTADGQELQTAVLTLAMWGNGRLGARQPDQFVPPSSLAMAFRATFDAAAAKDLSATWEIHTAGVILFIVVDEGQVTTGVGPAPGKPDLTITIRSDEVPAFPTIITALATGRAEPAARTELLDRLVAVFAPAGSHATA
jgi:DNA-binding HxlR family transcriptional regulator